MSRAARILESVELVDAVRVSISPRRFSRLSSDLDLKGRGINGNRVRFLSEEMGNGFDTYYWCSYDEVHIKMAEKLGLDYTDCASGEIQLVGGLDGWKFVDEVREGRPLDKPEVVADLVKSYRYNNYD